MAPPVGAALLVLVAVVLPAVVVAAGGEPQECTRKRDCVKLYGDGFACDQVNGVCYRKQSGNVEPEAADLTFCERKKDCKHLGKKYKCKNGVCHKKKGKKADAPKTTAFSRCKTKKHDDLFCTRKRHCRHLGSQRKCDRSLCTCVRIPTIRTNIDRFDQPDGRLGCNPGFSGPDGCLPDEGEDEDDGRR
eukprot:m.340137 g.340137  ORF g.340137 m.340137 type:complete len:189 (+) comp19824_c1_seq14:210-776(+)